MILRVGVVGCGAMGRHHARIWASLPDCELTALVDPREERAGELAALHGGEAFGSLEEILDKVDAVSVAAPTARHREIGETLLRTGIDVLMEKPLAATLEEADALLRAAGNDRVLAVGHTERFNPAVRALLEAASHPRFLEVHRLGSFPDRSTDIDAILDLMIHDLDIVLELVDRPLVSLEAVGIPVLTDKVDIANARLAFEGGCVANITASRVSRERVRKIRMFQHDTYVSVDYAARTGRITRLDRSAPREESIVSRELEVQEADDPLTRELEEFARAVRRRADPTVPAWQGRRALEAALAVREAIHRSLAEAELPPEL